MNRYNLKFGANVYGPNGRDQDQPIGHLAKVVVDPISWEVTDIVVKNGLLFKRATVIPLYKVESASPEAVHLLVSKDELNDYPEFTQTVVERGAQGWAQPASGGPKYTATSTGVLTAVPEVEVIREWVRLGVDEEALVLDNETEVNRLDDRIGYLGQLITDRETDQIKLLGVIINSGVLQTQELLIPAHKIETLGERSTKIAATKDKMPEF